MKTTIPIDIKSFKAGIKDFHQQSVKNGSEFHRYKSWEHCYLAFNDPKNAKNYDLLALHLSMYLASWGMYRGSSFMLELDYKVNLGIVELIKKSDKKFGLSGLSIWDLGSKAQDIVNLSEEIKKEYKRKLKSIIKTNGKKLLVNPSDTLSSKILLGTLGCIVAYDTYAKKTLKKHGISQVFNERSLNGVATLFSKQKNTLELIRKSHPGLKMYPDMKLIDMYCFKKGY
ncbi:MAG: hypothetical protein H7Z71_05595 [Moraxellaceae bacterium]|nr:hypothetical protein [Pseudobdellovibrionaceae bacterium]